MILTVTGLARRYLGGLRWHHLYFVLAAFDLITVSGSLYLSHRITGLYADSVVDNRQWAQRLGDYAALSQLAGDVNAPGNDVFDTRQVVDEREKLLAARKLFDTQLAEVRTDIVGLANKNQSAPLSADLDSIEAAMGDMVAEALSIFGFFENGQPERAGERMATMDRKYAMVIAGFAKLNAQVRGIQNDMFIAQGAAADQLRRYELLIAVFIVLMVGGITVYGHKLSRTMERAQRENETHRQALEAQTLELAKAKEVAEAASLAKSSFLAKMSHEIRTPMNGVLGMTDLLMRSGLTEKQQRYAETAHRSGTSLLTIINDILDFSRIEAGKFELHEAEFNLRQCVESTVELVAEQAFRKEIDLNLMIARDVPTTVVGDAARLRQVLLNIISNAIKFTLAGEVSVWLTCERDDTGKDLITIEVRDSGIGIAPELVRALFQPFMQADSSISRRFGGTGLGLSICRQLVGMMGGTVEIKSRLGRGTTVLVQLALPIGQGAAETLALEGANLAGQRILVLDASASNREIVRGYLEATGASVEALGNPERAFHLLKQAASQGEPFALIMMDLYLPGVNGIELGRRIKQEPTLIGLELVMLSSNLSREDARRAAEAGFREFIGKPIMRADLMHAVCRAVLAADRIRPVPVPRDVTATDATSAVDQRRGPAPQVLLAEDNPVNVEVARQYLDDLCCVVTLVENGKLAVAAAALRRYDIILMDCQMPEMDGLSATRRIRELESRTGRERTPIIAVTANAFEGDRQDCLAAGMDDYISKPFTQAQLEAAIQKWGRRGIQSPADQPARDAMAAEPAPQLAARTPPLASAPHGRDARSAETAGVLNSEMLAAMRSTQAELFERILAAFLTHAPKQCDQLVRAACDGNADLVRIAAHSLKSSCASVGADMLARMCRDLEEAARDKRASETYAQHAGQIQSGLERACEALRQELRAVSAEAA